jgi:two-component system, cell cycle sensor histidine kinase and response regulator CckA
VKTILVVDDDPAVLRLVQRILTRGGYEVLVAGSSVETLAIATHPRQIDLLLADVFLPCEHHCSGKGMLGPELAATLKEARSELRVILISGETGAEEGRLRIRGRQGKGKPWPTVFR